MQQMLKNVPVFAGLGEAAMKLLWERAIETNIPAGGAIVREGEIGNCFFLIGKGSVKVCKHCGQATEVELAKLGVGDFFGEMCILETLPRAATVLAVADSTLYRLNSLAFYQLYKAMPAQYSILILNMARDLSRRLRHLDEVFAAKH